MIQTRTILKVADNSGATKLMCIKVLRGTRRRYAYLGDIIIGVVKEADPRRIVKKHEIVKAVIVRQRSPHRRTDGSYIRFDDNAGVILNGDTKDPKGGRIFGPVAREVKDRGFDKIASLALELV